MTMTRALRGDDGGDADDGFIFQFFLIFKTNFGIKELERGVVI